MSNKWREEAVKVEVLVMIKVWTFMALSSGGMWKRQIVTGNKALNDIRERERESTQSGKTWRISWKKLKNDTWLEFEIKEEFDFDDLLFVLVFWWFDLFMYNTTSEMVFLSHSFLLFVWDFNYKYKKAIK